MSKESMHKFVLNRFQQILKFVLLSFVITLIPVLYFMLETGAPDNFFSFIYEITIPFYYYVILLLVSIVLFPLSLIPYVRYLVLIPKILFDFIFIADIFVFRIYRFHIDLMFIDMMMNDYEGVGVSPFIVIVSILVFISVIALNVYIYKIAGRIKFHAYRKLTVIFILIFFIGQVIHIWGYKFNRQYITRYTPYFPYFFPTTSNRLITNLSKTFPAIVPDNYDPDSNDQIIDNKIKKSDFFNYPLNQIEINDTLNTKKNILFFVVESWRHDMLKKDVTPNIYEFAKKSYVFSNHFSGGNVTISGLFSIFYGLHPSYMVLAQATPEEHGTVLTKTLEQYGYRSGIYVSQNFDRFALKTMFFNNVKPEDYHCIYKGKTEKIDETLTDVLVDDIKRDSKDEPWFRFIFLSSSHFHYSYPPAHKIFTPVLNNSEEFLFNKDVDSEPYLNDYRNSLHYEDALFKKIIDELRSSGEMENTIVLITSDHGEEFNDNKKGYWGHGSNFTRFQTSVPLIIHLPGQEEQVVVNKRSSHIDIVPTVLKYFLKCENPVSDYSNGHVLFDLPDKRNLVIASYKDKCYVIDDKVYSTGITVRSYDLDDVNQKNDKYNYRGLIEIKNEERVFIK